ncbi:hypothetical protein Q31b_32470 [Novipirellula aureliae]|uniref:Uncharacterized protein n=1 Tax=Novipirellula aureliae TaxID=2527966 RepID=A0A5C6DX23_9BACT|nr:hypothetical protein [Novipirellula aureliae]TWU39931.1 hypothetical protein Q31b_32470 [Novipirellula aureliae]
MSSQDKLVAELVRGLKHERDELQLQIHLASKELRDKWDALDRKLDSLDERYTPLKGATRETADDVYDSLKLLASEISAGFDRIRKSLKP